MLGLVFARLSLNRCLTTFVTNLCIFLGALLEDRTTASVGKYIEAPFR